MRPLRETVLVNGYFSYSHWGMFRLPVIWLPWWHAQVVADDDEIDDSRS